MVHWLTMQRHKLHVKSLCLVVLFAIPVLSIQADETTWVKHVTAIEDRMTHYNESYRSDAYYGIRFLLDDDDDLSRYHKLRERMRACLEKAGTIKGHFNRLSASNKKISDIKSWKAHEEKFSPGSDRIAALDERMANQIDLRDEAEETLNRSWDDWRTSMQPKCDDTASEIAAWNKKLEAEMERGQEERRRKEEEELWSD